MFLQLWAVTREDGKENGLKRIGWRNKFVVERVVQVRRAERTFATLSFAREPSSPVKRAFVFLLLLSWLQSTCSPVSLPFFQMYQYEHKCY